jgi:ABC-type Na+ efflux pump permease subunit
MRIWAIIRKDTRHQLRSGYGLVMMFAVPLLVTGLIYAAFNSILSPGSTPQMTQVRVQVANLDQGSNGEQLVKALQSNSLQTLLQVTLAPDSSSARAAVANQEADVAVIVPADFSQNPTAVSLTLVHDPALTVAPRIVQSILEQALDAANGARIAAQTAAESFAGRGLAVDMKATQNLAEQYIAQQAKAGSLAAIDALPKQSTQPQTSMIATIFVSMMILFMFFTGAQIAQSIVTEQEQGTLARLFTTSVRLPAVLMGKMGAAWLTLAIQAVILLGAAAMLFGFHWGDPVAIILLVVPMILACSSFGLLVIAFVKNARQAGAVIGGALTLSGMLGGLFTAVLPSSPAFIDTFSLVLPQGWAIRGWKIILAGGTVMDVLLPAAALLVIAAICFAIANTKLRKRFA